MNFFKPHPSTTANASPTRVASTIGDATSPKRPRTTVDDEDDGVKMLASRADDLDAVVKEPKRRANKHDAPRLAPEARYPDATMRCVFTDASTLSTTLLRMGTLGNDIVLDFAPTSSDAGLTVKQVDKSGVLLAELSMPRQAFILYHVPDAVCAPLFYEQVSGFAKACSHEHTLAFTATPKHRDRLCARMHSSRVDRTRIFDTIEPSNIVAVPSVPFRTWEYPVCVTMSARSFFEEIKVCIDNKGAMCILNVGHHNCSPLGPENAMCFTSMPEGGNNAKSYETIVEVGRVERRPGTVIKEERYILDFLRLASGFKDVADAVQVHFGIADYPLWLHFIMSAATDSHAETCVDVVVSSRA